jgi:hypothetical protein
LGGDFRLGDVRNTARNQRVKAESVEDKRKSALLIGRKLWPMIQRFAHGAPPGTSDGGGHLARVFYLILRKACLPQQLGSKGPRQCPLEDKSRPAGVGESGPVLLDPLRA